VCSIAAFMAFLDATIVNIAFPSIHRSFPHVATSWLSWVLNGYNIVFAALLVPAGQIADLVGRRRVFMVGLAMFTAASAACAGAGSSELLIALRAVQAAGAALVVPAALALVLGELPAHRRIAGVTLLSASAAVAAAVGPPLGGVLVRASSWRLVFLVNLPLGAAAWLVGRRALREQRDPEHGEVPDIPTVVLLTIAVGLLALGVTQGPDWGWDDPRILGSFAAAVGLLALVAARPRGREYGTERLFLRLRSVRTANLAVVVFAAAFYAKILTDVLFLTSVWGYSVLEAGAAITPGPLFTVLLAAPAARLARRRGLGPTSGLGAIVYACGCAWYALRAGTSAHYAADWLPGTVLTGAGIALAFPTLTAAAVYALPGRLYGTGSAVNSTARQLGGVLGIAGAVAIVGHAGTVGPHHVFVAAWYYEAIAAGLTALGALWLARVERAEGRGGPRATAPA